MGTTTMPVERRDGEDRTQWKRRVIVAAATEVFLTHGYVGASMDQVAALARASKHTVYQHFADKEELFTELVGATTRAVTGELAQAVSATLGGTVDDPAALARGLTALARRYLTGLLRPDVVRLRRLVVAEAERFPALGRDWWERGFVAANTELGTVLEGLAARGLLRDLGDPVAAAHQFAGLVLYAPTNQAMFAGVDAAVADTDHDRAAEAAVRVFLAAYGS